MPKDQWTELQGTKVSVVTCLSFSYIPGWKSSKSKHQIFPATIGILGYRFHIEGVIQYLDDSTRASFHVQTQEMGPLTSYSSFVVEKYILFNTFCYYVSIFRISSKWLRSTNVSGHHLSILRTSQHFRIPS